MTNIGAKEANYHSLIRISLLRFLSDVYKRQSLNRPVYSGSLFCRLLKQTAKENLRHKEQLSLFAHR